MESSCLNEPGNKEKLKKDFQKLIEDPSFLDASKSRERDKF
jgi:hypothetical protein